MTERQGLLVAYLQRIYQQMVAQRFRAQSACLELDPHAVLLDLGCKDGANTLDIARVIGTQRMVGLDCVRTAVGGAQARGVRAVLADANDAFPLADQCANVVTAMDLLEHLVDPASAIAEAFRVLQPGGYLVVATPNLASWHNVFALVIGQQPFSGPNVTTMLDSDVAVVRRLHRQAYDLESDAEIVASEAPALHRHIVVLTLRALLGALRRAGFVVEQARGFGYYPFGGLLARGLARLDPWHAHHLVVKARRPSSGAA